MRLRVLFQQMMGERVRHDVLWMPNTTTLLPPWHRIGVWARATPEALARLIGSSALWDPTVVEPIDHEGLMVVHWVNPANRHHSTNCHFQQNAHAENMGHFYIFLYTFWLSQNCSLFLSLPIIPKLFLQLYPQAYLSSTNQWPWWTFKPTTRQHHEEGDWYL